MTTIRTTKSKSPKASVKAAHRRLVGRRRKLEYGAVASVYPYKGKILKISDESDVGYYRYLKWCVKNQHNPFVPKIFRAHFFENASGNQYYTVVLMERLKPVEDAYSSHESQVAGAIRSYIQYGHEYVWKYIRNKYAKKHLEALRKAVHRINKSRRIRIDLHNENAMMRGGQVVITDPVVDNNI